MSTSKKEPTQNTQEQKNQTAFVYIPKDEMNSYEEVVEVSINGQQWNVARGTMVRVPLAVAKVLVDAKYIADYTLG